MTTGATSPRDDGADEIARGMLAAYETGAGSVTDYHPVRITPTQRAEAHWVLTGRLTPGWTLGRPKGAPRSTGRQRQHRPRSRASRTRRASTSRDDGDGDGGDSDGPGEAGPHPQLAGERA